VWRAVEDVGKAGGSALLCRPRAARPHDDEGTELVETDPWNNERVHGGNVKLSSAITGRRAGQLVRHLSGSQRTGLDQRHNAPEPRSGLSARSRKYFSWGEVPHNLIRDRDRIYGTIVTRQLRAMGIRDKPTAPGSLWQNGVAERLIESIWRERVDHIIVLGETYLRRILRSLRRLFTIASERIDL
jgi:hypothetical protein